MKKLFALMLLLAGMVPFIKAQDVIITQDAQRIDATVLEISDTEIRYKRADNPDGPVFVLSTSKIASIIYKNGEVQTFANQTPANENAGQNAQYPQGTQGAQAVYTVREAEDIMFVPGQQLVKSEKRGKYYYGNIELDEGLYKDFLKLTCNEAYKTYSNGASMVWGGSFVEGFGLGMMLGSLWYVGRQDLTIWGAIFGTGIVLVGVGIPLIVVGGNKQNKALNIFNAQCSSSLDYKQALSLNFGVTSNGIGVTLKF